MNSSLDEDTKSDWMLRRVKHAIGKAAVFSHSFSPVLRMPMEFQRARTKEKRHGSTALGTWLHERRKT